MQDILFREELKGTVLIIYITDKFYIIRVNPSNLSEIVSHPPNHLQ
jgi:hypothetical protein